MFLSWGVFILCFSQLALHVCANTEIINFSVASADDARVPAADQWPILNHSENERQWSINPAPFGTPLGLVCEQNASQGSNSSSCPYEIWISLDLTQGGWDAYNKFTLRLSWPASFSADYSMQIYNPGDVAARFTELQQVDTTLRGAKTRRKYARIRVVDAGVPTPAQGSDTISSNSIPPVPVIVILEPLYFGVLPASVTPVLGFICLVLLAAGIVAPKITQYLQELTTQAREEANLKRE